MPSESLRQSLSAELCFKQLLIPYQTVSRYYREIPSKIPLSFNNNYFSITAASADDSELAEELRKDAMQRKAAAAGQA
jgi:hypothetical protein